MNKHTTLLKRWREYWDKQIATEPWNFYEHEEAHLTLIRAMPMMDD